jgi:hypothetical protein
MYTGDSLQGAIDALTVVGTIHQSVAAKVHKKILIFAVYR